VKEWIWRCTKSAGNNRECGRPIALFRFDHEGKLASVEATGRGEIANIMGVLYLECVDHGPVGSLSTDTFDAATVDAVKSQRRATFVSDKSSPPAQRAET
jgi:hypothetical protein